MKFNSLADILKFAITKEEASVLFYRSLIGLIKNINTVAVLEAMAREEEKHIDAIKLELFKLGVTIKDSASQEGASEGGEIVLEIDKKVEEMTPLDFMRMGVQKERSSFMLYAELMVLAEDMDSRKMFLELAEEEMRHVINLEREVEVLIRPRKD